MGPTIDDPTTAFLRYLTESDAATRPGTASVRTAVRLPPPPDDHDDETQQARYLIQLFAALSVECRRADLSAADAICERIAELGTKSFPELVDLAQSMVAQTRGDYRLAESLLTACLRRPHTYESLTRPVAHIERATLRMLLGLLDAALSDLNDAEGYGASLLSLHGLAVKSLIHWWRGDEAQAVEALELGPRYLIKGLDLGVVWYALAAEFVRNGQLFAENLDRQHDCLARDFWEARGSHATPMYVAILGPHMIRHEMAMGNDAAPLLEEFRPAAVDGSAAARAFAWCVALVEGDVDVLAEVADRYRDEGILLAAIQAYRDAASYAESPESQERFSRRGRLIYERLSRAIKVKSRPDLPDSLARALTDAEQNVVAAVALGLSNREAAELLNCSVRTIESHLTRTYRKLGIKRRTQLPVLIAQAKMES
ncbi:MAG: LuxR C-terminal-related transcriptional regulator [Acidimicrobiia bacterium]|nr:LuxR C-terminal-related transcriptional regulator [Acidimicrobiia bacterium]